MSEIKSITLEKPIDYHLHLRDGLLMQSVLPYSAAAFCGGIVMPNLTSPIYTQQQACAYRESILSIEPDFSPFLTCYLTEDTQSSDLISGFYNHIFIGAKLYPKGVTTNSTHGISNIRSIYHILSLMEKSGMPLLIHGETTDKKIDIFDREEIFIERTLIPLLQDFPALKVVLEHITTKQAVDFVLSAPSNVVATVTPHHLVLDRNDLFIPGIQPHNYCLPIVKRHLHKKALCKAITSGSQKFFPGTDSAPHLRASKEATCGCAGIFNAAIAIPIYIMIFDTHNAMEYVSLFLNRNGRDFYGLQDVSSEECSFIKEPFQPLPDICINNDSIYHFFYPCSWRAIS